MKKLLILLTMGFSATVKAQIPQPDPDTTASHFLILASIKNLQEVKAGELAEKLATSSEVKSFGQMMVKDHGEAEQKLLQLAKSSHQDLPPEATGIIKPDLMLKNAGSKFDQLYVHAMVSGHQNTVEVFQNYATTGKNPLVKAFAAQMLPILKQHLTEIKAIEEKFKTMAR